MTRKKQALMDEKLLHYGWRQARKRGIRVKDVNRIIHAARKRANP